MTQLSILFLITCLVTPMVGRAAPKAAPKAPKKATKTVSIPVDEFGMKQGDLVQSIDGKSVPTPLDGIAKLMRDRGKIQRITVLRDGQPVELKRK
ncbi:MAG TPA: hypothetical protein VJB59_13035 [Bdellovibrionota bacterium]|nr:hypothetical protein [Bdellovibrionota bacterium]